MRYLESDRLLLKPVEEADIAALLELRWDKSIMQYLVHDPIGMKQQKEWFQGLGAKNLALSIFLKSGEDAELIGTIGLYEINMRHQRAIWRLRLTPRVQGKGIGFEATRMLLEYGFYTLNLHKICSDSFSDNAAIVKLSKKLGFTDEGLLRKHYYHEGEFRDVIFFGILKEDFIKLHKQDAPAGNEALPGTEKP